MEHCTVRDAAVKLAAWFSLTPNNTAPRLAAKGGIQKPPAAENGGEGTAENKTLTFQLKGVDPSHAYLRDRGIQKETAEAFGVGIFSGKGTMSGRCVIPIHNERGELVAYAGRAIDDSEPKYKLPSGFRKSLELFNFHRAVAKTPAGRGSTVVLVEGFFDCMKVNEAGYPCVALMGCSLSSEQEHLLCRHFTGVILLLDGDDAGRAGTDDCLLRLGRELWVKAIQLTVGAQPDSLTIGELEQLLSS